MEAAVNLFPKKRAFTQLVATRVCFGLAVSLCPDLSPSILSPGPWAGVCPVVPQPLGHPTPGRRANDPRRVSRAHSAVVSLDVWPGLLQPPCPSEELPEQIQDDSEGTRGGSGSWWRRLSPTLAVSGAGPALGVLCFDLGRPAGFGRLQPGGAAQRSTAGTLPRRPSA